MFEAEDIRDWRDMSVVDTDGDKVGTLEAIYVDTATDQPAFGTVRTGLMGGRKLTFVPLAGAKVAPKHLRVTPTKRLIKDAPSIDLDGELAASDEPEIFRHYGLAHQAGAGGERRLGRR